MITLSSVIEDVPLSSLRPHPESALLFPPRADFDWLVKSIKKHGQESPIVAKADGTVLDGHLRLAALQIIGATTAQVRRVAADTYHDEITLMVTINCVRTQFTPREVKRADSDVKAALRRAHAGKDGAA